MRNYLITSLAAVALGTTLYASKDAYAHGDHDHDAEFEAEIEGLSHHYHSGDMVELTAVMDVDEEGHWHWYEKKEDQDEWITIDGELESTFEVEAEDGMQYKAIFYNNDHDAIAESNVVTISIDDHNDVYNGYFEDEDIEDRDIEDWVGEWQSVYPYLESGDLDEVFEHKADKSDEMDAEEYKEYYTTGYETEVDNLVIDEDGTFTFISEEKEVTGSYVYDGYEILEYEKGNRGVRFIFKLEEGDDDAPEYIQFSDHIIAPEKSGHFHLYWGDDREELLEEVTHWPTYYPDDLTVEDIIEDMLKH